MSLSLPAINACFNTLSVLFLLGGFIAIRRKKIPLHRVLMGGALLSSTLFLIGYLTHHANGFITRFQGTGVVRVVYFTILLSHTVLAAVLLPLVITTLTLALRERMDRHRAWARWTWPIWMYVSVTGVVIYLMLYHGPR